jgi:nucleotide-binding universal stress UspA family protein
MFHSILVGTDGSSTATAAVDEAITLAAEIGARLLIVSAYEPISELRLRNERQSLPEDTQWMVNPREDVLAVLEIARASATDRGVTEVETFARQGDASDRRR